MRLFSDHFWRFNGSRKTQSKAGRQFNTSSEEFLRRSQVLIYVNSQKGMAQDCLKGALESFKGSDLLIVCDTTEESVRAYLKNFAAEHSARFALNLDVLGYRRSVIKGIQLSNSQYLVVLDAEVVPTAGALRELVEHLSVTPHADVAIPLLNVQLVRYLQEDTPDRSDSISFVRAATPEVVAAALDSVIQGASYASQIDCFQGYPCFAIRRTAFSKLASWKVTAAAPARSHPHEYAAKASACVSVIAVPSAYVSCRSRSLPEVCPEDPAIPDLSSVVQSIQHALARAPRVPRLIGRRVLFLLPSPGGNGGAHSVVQELIGLRRCGVDARIANLPWNRRAFERNYPEALDFCSYPDNDAGLLELAAGPAIVIATNYTSVSSLKTIVENNPAAIPFYYIQDYEPWFYPEDGAQHAAAKASYTMVPNAIGFAKTEWLRRTVKRMEGIDVVKIEPSLDRSLYNHLGALRNRTSRVAITAMIRPNTARRNPVGTLRLLRKIKQKHARTVDIRIFGCSDEELDQIEEARGFDLINFGELKREQVADVLRGADIFVDLSTSQAFGCTGLEAMALGCMAVLPRDTGVEEYAVDGQNCLLVDSSNETEAVAALERLMDDRSLQGRFKTETIRTSLRYSIRTAVWSLLLLFQTACDL